MSVTSDADDAAPAGDEVEDPHPGGGHDHADRVAGLGNGGPAGNDDATPPPRRPAKSGGGQVLGAAMLGLGQVIEPEKASVNIEIEAPSDPDDDRLPDLDFGDLPDLG